MPRKQTQLIVGWRKEFPFNFVEKHAEDKQIWSTHTLFSSYLLIKKQNQFRWRGDFTDTFSWKEELTSSC